MIGSSWNLTRRSSDILIPILVPQLLGMNIVVHQVEQPATAPCLTPANKQLRILSVLQTTHDRTLAVAAQRKRANST